MFQIAELTAESIFFLVIVVAIIAFIILAILIPMFIYLINSRLKDLLNEQQNSNFDLFHENQKINERLEELQVTNSILLQEMKKQNQTCYTLMELVGHCSNTTSQSKV